MMDDFIYLHVINERNPGAAAIRWFTKSKATHIEFCIKPGEFTPGGYLGARIAGGVALRPWGYCNDVIDEWFGAVACTSEQEKKVIEFAISQLGCWYDLTDILGLITNTNLAFPRTWICSQLVDTAMEEGNIHMTDKDPDAHTTPAMLFNSKLFLHIDRPSFIPVPA